MDHVGRGALDETRVGELLFLGSNEAGEFFDLLLFAGNLGRHVDQFGFNTRISPTSIIDDGLLNLCIIRKPLIYYAAFVIPFIFLGLAHKTPFVRTFKITDVRIIQQKNNIAHIDGDEIDLGKELEVKVVPSSLRLIC